MPDDPGIYNIEWYMLHTNKYLGLMVVNSFILRSITYPFVLVKTRLQIQKKKTVYTGSYDAFEKIIKNEGCRGLYRGFWTNSTLVFSNMAYLVAYEKIRDLVTNYTNISDSKTKAFIAGGMSSAVSSGLGVPADVVSQHIMVALTTGKSGTESSGDGLRSSYFKPLKLNPEDIRRYRLAGAVAKEVYRESGFKGFYRGYFAAIMCYVPSAACWWMLYQFFTEFFYNLSKPNLEPPQILLHPMSGALSGISVTILTNPLDLLRVNIQVHRPSSYASAAKYLWKEDHLQVFTKGLTARLTQSCISSALVVLGYETVKKWSIDEKYRDKVRW